MKKIFLYATYPTQTNGYAKIANIISNYLASFTEELEIYYFGISNFGNGIERYIHEKINLIDVYKEEQKLNLNDYGINIIEKYIDKIKPDILFLYNDLIVLNRIFLALKDYHPFITKKIQTYVYLDLVYKYEKIELINHLNCYSDKIFVFSDFWKDNLIDMKINPEKIYVMYHGFTSSHLHELDKKICRKKLNISEDCFVVLNTNRNCYRKGYDITISSFLIFLKKNYNNNNIKLFLNCLLNTKEGYDILNLIQTECLILDLPYEEIIMKNIICLENPAFLDDNTMNLIFNSCDIGINTCFGEGFGLCNLEHGGLACPQIITSTGGLKDIFEKDYHKMTVIPKSKIYIPNLLDEHGGYIEISNTQDFADKLQYYYENKKERINDGIRLGKYIRDKYDWNKILNQFYIDFTS
jgi:glycosyltransferase involved in cell wall biosynthesis